MSNDSSSDAATRAGPSPSPSPWTVSLSAPSVVAVLAASTILTGMSFRAGSSAVTSTSSLVRGVVGPMTALSSKAMPPLYEHARGEPSDECPWGKQEQEQEQEDSSDDEDSDDDGGEGYIATVRSGTGMSLTMDFEGRAVDWPALHLCLSDGRDSANEERCHGDDDDGDDAAAALLEMGERTAEMLISALSDPPDDDGDSEDEDEGEEEDGDQEEVAAVPLWRTLGQHCHSTEHGGSGAVHCTTALSARSHLILSVFPPSSAAAGGANDRDNGYEGAVHLTLFASEVSSSVVFDVVPRLKRVVMGPPTEDENVDAAMDTYVRVSIRSRGTGTNRKEGGRWDIFATDLGEELFGWSKVYAREIASGESIFQRIDVYDVLDPRQVEFDRYRRSLLPPPDGSDGAPPPYESLHPEHYAPDRHVLLDGVFQSTRRGEAQYHEALVHPAMFLHPNPRRVAIIGGGEGATLREVLKHGTVEHVKMIDIDEVMVRMSDEFLPEWNDCSDVEGSRGSCFEDPRADVLYEDAMAWFIDRFGPPGSDLHGTEEKFDVIIMDALDPEDTVEFANVLYRSDVLATSLRDGLTEDGVLVMQLGAALYLSNPPEEMQLHSNRAEISNRIADVGFESMHTFEESHCGFESPWTFLVACKTRTCRARFYRTEAQVERDIHRRIRRRRGREEEGRVGGGGVSGFGGRSLLRYFDGATMKSYGAPHKASEVAYCRKKPKPIECKMGTGYSLDRTHFGIDDFEVRAHENGTFVGVFARVDIPKQSYISADSVGISFPVTETPGIPSRLFPLEAFFEEFGMNTSVRGKMEWHADPGVHLLLQHGSNSTFNVGHLGSWTRRITKSGQLTLQSTSNRVLSSGAPVGAEDIISFGARSLVLDRHLSSFTTGFLMALRDIRAGEALLKIHE